jgi:amino acid transporter
MPLRHELSFADLIMLGLGNVVGAGIFVITSKLIFYGGKKALLSILIISLLSLAMGYIYLQLHNEYSSEIVEYEAIRDNLGNISGKVSLFLIYFFAVASCVVISVALTKYITHSGYYSVSKNYDKIITIGLIALMCFINYLGITTSKHVINVIGGAMLIMLFGIIIMGGYFALTRQTSTPSTPSQTSQTSKPSPKNGFIIATILSIFLFNGYDIIVKMSAETKNPDDIGIATMTVISLTAIIYICVIISLLVVLGIHGASHTHHPLSLIYEKLTNSAIAKVSYAVGGFVMFNTAFISILGGTRFFYGNIKHNTLLNHINRYGSPSIIILITFIIATVMSLMQNEVILAIITNFTVIIILLLLNLSYLNIKWTDQERALAKEQAQEQCHDQVGRFIIFISNNWLFIASLILLLFLFIKVIEIYYSGDLM